MAKSKGGGRVAPPQVEPPESNLPGDLPGLPSAAGASVHPKRYAPQVWEEARRLYEETKLTGGQISARLGVSSSQLRFRAKTGNWVRQKELEAALQAAGPGERMTLLARLYRAFERQVSQLEERLGRMLAPDGEGELATLADVDRTARTLASLARTLDMLLSLQKSQQAEETDERNPDDLRAELAKRLGSLPRGGGHGSGSEPPDLGGDGLSHP